MALKSKHLSQLKRHRIGGVVPHIIKRRKLAKSAKKRPKEKSISKLIKACDAAFSIKVRMLGAQETQYGLMNRCYTCGNAFEVKRLHAGHYVSRMFKAARWHFDNARPQCFACNIYRKGDAAKFRQNLVKEIGEARVLAVEKLRDAPIKLTRDFLEQTLKDLSQNPVGRKILLEDYGIFV